MRHKLGDAFLDEDTTTNFKRVLKHGCTINEVHDPGQPIRPNPSQLTTPSYVRVN